MIRAAILSLAVLAMSTTSYGADATDPVAKDSAETYTYIVGMTGVTWGGCKKYVREAFSKLDGVVVEDAAKEIIIKDGEEKGKQLVAFKSTSSELTKEKAIEAIGDKKERFVVETFGQGDWPEDSES